MSLDRVQELARQFGDAIASLAQGEEVAEREHYEALLEGIKTMVTALTPLVPHIAQPVPGVNPDWKWQGVYLPSCGGYLLASGKIFLPSASGEVNAQRDVRDPTYTVIEILNRRTQMTFETRETEMHGLFVSLNQALRRALEKVEERQQQRSLVAAGIGRDLAALTPSTPGRSLG